MKICPKCHKSFPDGVKLCPFDRIALTPENAGATSNAPSESSVQAQHGSADLPEASEIKALDLVPDGSGRLLFQTVASYHAPMHGLMIFGGGLLFMVFASVTGMKSSRSGSAAPTMSGETAAMLAVVGILALAAGLALQHFFRHYTLFDFRRKMVLRQARAFGKNIWEGSLIRQDQIVAIGTTTRVANMSAENLKLILTKYFSNDGNKGLPYDVSLVMLGKDAKEYEITAFRNGSQQARLAAARAEMLAWQLNLPCQLCKEGEQLEVIRKPGKPLNFYPVLHSEIAKRPANIANKVLSWVILVSVLVGGWFILMHASGVWKK